MSSAYWYSLGRYLIICLVVAVILSFAMHIQVTGPMLICNLMFCIVWHKAFMWKGDGKKEE